MTTAHEPASPTLSRFLSQKVEQIPPSGIRKFFDLLSSMEDVISLGVGEPDFVTPWHIREAGIYSMEKGRTSYTSNYGLLDLRFELTRHLERLYGLDYDPRGELLVTVGVSEALDLALRAILNPGDEVIVPDPTYVSYVPCTIMAGGIPVPVPTRVEDDFQLNPSEVASRITPRTKALVLAYPNNPTGAVMDKARLEEIARLAEERDLLVISDEIYDRLVYGVEHVCFPTLPQMRDRTVLLGGLSKAYAMTGWRIGFAAAPAEILEAMVKVHQYTIMSAPTAGQYAALEALRQGEADVRDMREEYDRRRRVIVQGLNQLGLDCFEPRGAFYAFPSIRSTGLSSEEFAQRLLVEEKVAVVPGNAFGSSGEGHVRCCYATSMENIEQALERMGRFLGKL